MTTIDQLTQDLATAQAEIARYREKHRWIPVEESLPKKGNPVKIWLQNYGSCMAYLTIDHNVPYWWCRGQQQRVYPTHWQLDDESPDKQALSPSSPSLQEYRDMKADSERLNFLLHKLPGDSLRYVMGELSDTSDEKEFRESIDKARGRTC